MSVCGISEIGALIQQRRTDLGLTQHHVARRAGVSRDWIVSIENGRRVTVDFDRLTRTLEVLDLSVEIGARTIEDRSDADRAVLERIGPAPSFGRDAHDARADQPVESTRSNGDS